jgi:hypothetical protein
VSTVAGLFGGSPSGQVNINHYTVALAMDATPRAIQWRWL